MFVVDCYCKRISDIRCHTHCGCPFKIGIGFPLLWPINFIGYRKCCTRDALIPFQVGSIGYRLIGRKCFVVRLHLEFDCFSFTYFIGIWTIYGWGFIVPTIVLHHNLHITPRFTYPSPDIVRITPPLRHFHYQHRNFIALCGCENQIPSTRIHEETAGGLGFGIGRTLNGCRWHAIRR